MKRLAALLACAWLVAMFVAGPALLGPTLSGAGLTAASAVATVETPSPTPVVSPSTAPSGDDLGSDDIYAALAGFLGGAGVAGGATYAASRRQVERHEARRTQQDVRRRDEELLRHDGTRSRQQDDLADVRAAVTQCLAEVHAFALARSLSQEPDPRVAVQTASSALAKAQVFLSQYTSDRPRFASLNTTLAGVVLASPPSLPTAMMEFQKQVDELLDQLRRVGNQITT